MLTDVEDLRVSVYRIHHCAVKTDYSLISVPELIVGVGKTHRWWDQFIRTHELQRYGQRGDRRYRCLDVMAAYHLNSLSEPAGTVNRFLINVEVKKEGDDCVRIADLAVGVGLTFRWWRDHLKTGEIRHSVRNRVRHYPLQDVMTWFYLKGQSLTKVG